MRKILPLWILLSSSFANAESFNILTCEVKRPASRCTIVSHQIFEGYDFEVDYNVQYRFPCRGHNFPFGLRTGNGFKKIDYSSVTQSAQLTGLGPLMVFDPNPDETKKLTFLGECALEIISVDALPSLVTISFWNRESIAQAKMIDKSIHAYILARDFENYRTWDRLKTETLLDSVTRKISGFEDLCDEGDEMACRTKSHFQVIRNSLQAKLESAPELKPPHELDIENVTQYYLEELIAEVSIGKEMIERFEVWEVEVEKSLASVLKVIPSEAR